MAEVLTTKEAAAYMRLSTDTLKRLARSGRLLAAKAGRQWRWRKADLDEFLTSGGLYVRQVKDDAYVTDCEARAQERRLSPEELKARLGLQ